MESLPQGIAKSAEEYIEWRDFFYRLDDLGHFWRGDSVVMENALRFSEGEKTNGNYLFKVYFELSKVLRLEGG